MSKKALETTNPVMGETHEPTTTPCTLTKCITFEDEGTLLPLQEQVLEVSLFNEDESVIVIKLLANNVALCIRENLRQELTAFCTDKSRLGFDLDSFIVFIVHAVTRHTEYRGVQAMILETVKDIVNKEMVKVSVTTVVGK